MHRCGPVLLFLCALLIFSSCKVSRHVSLPAGVDIVTREQWGAAPPVLPVKKHTINRITIHHTAVNQNYKRTLRQKLKGLQKFSQERSPLSDGRIKEPWADIPYHFYIDVHGTIGEGRELQYAGDSNTPYDPTGHALIVLEGSFDKEVLTEKQYTSLKKLVVALATEYKVSPDKISGHKDHAQTGCPGNNLYALIPELKLLVKDTLHQ